MMKAKKEKQNIEKVLYEKKIVFDLCGTYFSNACRLRTEAKDADVL